MYKTLTTEDNYTTDLTKKSFLSKVPGKSIFFYSAIIYDIIISNNIARKGLYSRNEWISHSKRTMDIMEYFGGEIEIEGLENLRKLDKPVVFIANHMSTLETFILPSIIAPFNDFCFVIKEDLLKLPLFGKIVGSTFPIAVSRANGRKDLQLVINEGCKRIESGKSVCIFPQGTRHSNFDPNKFNSLGNKLAEKANVPIIPIALKTDFWSQGTIVKDFGLIYPKRKIKLSFGELIDDVKNTKECHAKCVEFISKKLTSWGVDCSTKKQ